MFVENISKDKALAYQLSHNALVGRDDLAMLRDIFNEIEGLKEKEFTGLNDLVFLNYDKIHLPTINEDDIELHEITFIFTKSKAKQVSTIIDLVNKTEFKNDTRLVLMEFEEFMKAMGELQKVCKIKSNTVAFVKMIDIVKDYVEKNKE